MNYRTLQGNRGVTLPELLVVVGITGIIVLALTSFQKDIFFNSKFAADSLTSAQDARSILRTMIAELRVTSPSSNGAYAIAQAATSSITFFSDTDGDGIKDQIRYYLTGTTTLKKGVVKPTGSPLVYNSANETFKTLAINLKNSSSTPLFEYYDSGYAGTSSPMTYPLDITRIRLVKINLLIDADPNRSPVPRTYTSQTSLRNLKDNL